MGGNRFTIADLKQRLEPYDDNAEVIFGTGDLTFSQVTSRGGTLIQIEFREIYQVTYSPD